MEFFIAIMLTNEVTMTPVTLADDIVLPTSLILVVQLPGQVGDYGERSF